MTSSPTTCASPAHFLLSAARDRLHGIPSRYRIGRCSALRMPTYKAEPRKFSAASQQSPTRLTRRSLHRSQSLRVARSRSPDARYVGRLRNDFGGSPSSPPSAVAASSLGHVKESSCPDCVRGRRLGDVPKWCFGPTQRQRSYRRSTTCPSARRCFKSGDVDCATSLSKGRFPTSPKRLAKIEMLISDVTGL